MCAHIFNRYLHQTWNFVLRSFILITLASLAFSGQAGMSGAEAKSSSVSNVALPVSPSISPQEVVAGGTESAARLSIDYSTLDSTGESASEASAIGFVLYDGVPVAGAAVTIYGSTGDFTSTTGSGPLSSDPYFTVTLSDPPLSAAPGDLLKMAVSYSGEQNTSTFMVAAGEQELYGHLSSTCGPTEITSILIGVDTTWTPECGPYIIRQNLKVLDTKTLTVTAGTTVEFDADRNLWVEGALSAAGTPNEIVTFTSHISQTAGSWSYLQFANPTTPSLMSYSLVEYAGGADVDNSAAIQAAGGDVVLVGVTVRHSASDGVQVYNDADVQMSYLTVADNSGWGIVEESTTDFMEIYTSTVQANGEGGIWIKSAGTVTITNNLIADNLGSGVEVSESTNPVMVTENTISGNQATRGAGVYFHGLADGNLEHNLIWDNEAKFDGGGIFTGQNSLAIRDNFILDNRITTDGKGGGMYLIVRFQDMPVFRNVIAGNSSVGTGGGIHVYYMSSSGSCNMQYNSFVHNQAAEQGSAVYADHSDLINLTIENNTILDNIAGAGQGALHLTALSNPINYNNMYGNEAYTLFYGAADAPDTTLDARGNWWGSIIPSVIPPQIWDKFDDASLAEVDFTNWQVGPVVDAPVSPPTGLVSATETFTVTLDWSDNPESDLAGYKLYFSKSETLMIDAVLGDLTGVDVGTDTSVAITDLPLGIYYMGVTAYDADLDGEDDWTDGNESWFSTLEEVHIGTDPQASFSASPLSGEVPLTVGFTDTSTGDFDTWEWAFGDGGTSTDQHPTHEYTDSGVYTVTLTIDGPLGSTTETKPAYISVLPVGADPQADFSASPLSGEVPLTVGFTDTSTGDIDTWGWAFGDGDTSTEQHTTHIFTDSGMFTITLTISGTLGSDSETKPEYISVLPQSNLPKKEILLPLIEN